jgi:hypothetical protein
MVLNYIYKISVYGIHFGILINIIALLNYKSVVEIFKLSLFLKVNITHLN